MKALIINSTMQSNVGRAEDGFLAGLEPLPDGWTVFSRQVRICNDLGITDFVVVVESDEAKWREAVDRPRLSNCSFVFVTNEEFAGRGSLFAMCLAKDYVVGDSALVFDGNLVFNSGLVRALLNDPRENLALYDSEQPLSESALKVRTSSNCKMQEISSGIRYNDCYNFLPLYKLSDATLGAWMEEVELVAMSSEAPAQAEEALNHIVASLDIELVSSGEDYIEQLNSPSKVRWASDALPRLDWRDQCVNAADNVEEALKESLQSWACARPFVVAQPDCVQRWQEEVGCDAVFCPDFSDVPTFEQLCQAWKLMKESDCDAIVSVGADHAIEFGKMLHALSSLAGAPDWDCLADGHLPVPEVRHIAIPTTAGTGSESTRFASLIYDGKECTVFQDNCLPDLVLLAPRALADVPKYQKKTDYLEALCRAVESIWSANATADSRGYAVDAIKKLVSARDGYFKFNHVGAMRLVAEGANLAGKAFNVSGPTACQYVSEALGSELGLACGHVQALYLPAWWELFLHNSKSATLPGGGPALDAAFSQIASAFGVKNGNRALRVFCEILSDLDLEEVEGVSKERILSAVAAIPAAHVDNSPLHLQDEDYIELYRSAWTSPENRDEPKVSVVVPVYNVEELLERCLNSLVNQTLRDIEIVVVNDGSPDNSQQIIERFEAAYPQIVKGYVKENGGLSDARNYGIARATGHYLSFVDSDDYVEPGFLEEMYEKAIVDRADIVCCGVVNEYEDRIEKTYYDPKVFGDSVWNKPKILSYANSFAWNKIYERSFWLKNGFEFPMGQWFEDSAVVYNVMLAANKVSCVNYSHYHYCHTRDESITNNYDPRVFDILKSVNSIVAYYKEQGAFEPLNEEVEYICIRHLFARLKVMLGGPDKAESRRFASEACAFLDREFPNWSENRYLNPDKAGNKTKIHKFVQRDERLIKLALSVPGPVVDGAYGLFDIAKGGKTRIKRKLNEKKSKRTKRFYVKKNGLEVMADVQQTLRDMDIQSFADFGTCLGLVREGHLLEHDVDVDMGVIAAAERRDEIRTVLEKKGYKLWRQYVYNGNVVEESYNYRRVKVDLNYYVTTDSYARTWLFYRKPHYRYEKDNLRHVVRMDYKPISGIHFREFDGIKIALPNNPEQLLEQKYGENWRIPDTGWIYWQSPAATPMDEIGYFVGFVYHGSVTGGGVKA